MSAIDRLKMAALTTAILPLVLQVYETCLLQTTQTKADR